MNEPSPAQIQFLKSKKREKQFIFTARCLIFIVFLVSWELSARTGVIDSFIFSSPSQIIFSFCHMWQEEELFTHIAVTLKETLLSFLFVVIFGTGAAVLMWGMPKLSRICEPYLVVLNSLPKSALAPLLIVWLGANQRKIVLPSSIPLLLSIMKVNIGLCLVGVIIGEFIGARQGLGYLIIYGSQTFKLDWMLTSIFILCVIAMTLYGILGFVEKRYRKHF